MSDLTKGEQALVRAVLRFLRAKCGGWLPVCKALRHAVSASIAVRVARLSALASMICSRGGSRQWGRAHIAEPNRNERTLLQDA